MKIKVAAGRCIQLHALRASLCFSSPSFDPLDPVGAAARTQATVGCLWPGGADHLRTDGHQHRLWGPLLGNPRAPTFHLGSPGTRARTLAPGRLLAWAEPVQDLHGALDRWQQVLSWLDLAGNDHRQQDPENAPDGPHPHGPGAAAPGPTAVPCTSRCSVSTATARQHKQQQWEQQGSQYRTGPLAEIQEQEG